METEKFGPQSFAVLNNETFFILDSVDKQVEIFNKSGELTNTIKLPENKEYYDIEVRSNGSVIVLTYDGNLLEYDNKQVFFLMKIK